MAALVVHLMSPGAASVHSDWDAPDGSVSHRVMSWRAMPPAISKADLVVAHGLAALVVAQTLANVGPGLVYRPTGPTRSRRRPWSRRLRASWIAAPGSRPGLAAAAALGLNRDRVVVVGDEDLDGWNRLALSLVRYEQIDADLLPSKPTRRIALAALPHRAARPGATRPAAKTRGERPVQPAEPVVDALVVDAPVEPVVDARVVDMPAEPEPATEEASAAVETPPVVAVPAVDEVPAVQRVSRRVSRRATKAQRRRGIEPVDVPVVEAPVVEEPVVEEPVVEEPVVEAPAVEEAVVEVAAAKRTSRRVSRRATKAQRRRGIEPVDVPVAEATPDADEPDVTAPTLVETPQPLPVPEPPTVPAPPRPGPAPVPEPPAAEPVVQTVAPTVAEPVPEPTVVAPVVQEPAIAARTDTEPPRIAPAAPRGLPIVLQTGSVAPDSPGQPWWKYRRMDIPTASAPGGAVVKPASNGERRRADRRKSGRGGASRVDAGPDEGQRSDQSGDEHPANEHPGNGGATAWPPTGEGPPPPPPPRPPDAEPDPHPGPEPEPEAQPRSRTEIIQQAAGSGVGLFIIGMFVLGFVVGGAQFKMTREGPFLVPLAGFFFVLAAGRRIVRKHPAEAWVANWLLLGYAVKLGAVYFRYFTSTVTYGGGDVTGYDLVGRQFAQAWLTGGRVPVLTNLHETNFIRWFTGVVYFIFGQNLLTGSFVFGLFAFIGSYFWYRATVDAVPMIDRKLYLGFVMFAPSITFWPAEVGKEALMQLGLGTMALGLSFLFRQQLLSGLMIAVSGGWLVWVVRPHLLAMVAIAGGAAYLAGRTRPRAGKKKAGLFSRPLGILIVAFLVAFTIGQGAKFLGLSSFSFSSIQTELDATTASSAQGGSSFNNGGHTLNPVNYPQDVLTVLIRPFPWEVGGGLQLVASAEGMILAGLIVFRFESLRIAFRRSRETPYFMFCWVLVALYCVAFSSFANFGLLVRERSLVLPAVLVLVAVDPSHEHRRRKAELEAEQLALSPVGSDPARLAT